MTLTARLATAFSILLLTACGAGAVTTTYFDTLPNYEPSWFSSVAGGRDFRVIIRGNPTPATQEEFNQAVIAAMQGKPGWAPRTNYSTRPSESAYEGFWIALVFGGDRYIGGHAVCRAADGIDLDWAARPLRLQAAFCHGPKPLTEIQATIDDVSSVADPRLDHLISQTMIQLLPLRDDDRDDDCRRPSRC